MATESPSLPLLVPKDEQEVDAFMKGLGTYGAVFAEDGTLVDKVDLDDGWFILIISQAQAEALKEQVGLDVKCRWRSRHNNCIVYATREAVELLDLRHIPDALTPNKDGNVDIVRVPENIAPQLRAVTIDKVGFKRAEMCYNEGIDDAGNRVCTSMLIADIDAEQNAVVVRVISGRNARIIAKLPKRMAEIRDPYLTDSYYVAWGEDGRVIAMTPTKYFNAFIEEINNTSGPYWVRDFRNINSIKGGVRVINGPISAGLADDGSIIDPFGVLDLRNYGKGTIKSLIAVFNWLHKYYGDNQKYAWLNVAFTMAKLITPVIRKDDQEFIDYIIWNRGRGFEGKSTLVNEVLKRMLGVHDFDPYFVVMSGPINTPAQARTLIALNRLPLILDEQSETLVDYAQILHSAAVGFGVMSIHAPRYGLDTPVRFRNMRPVLVFTNVPFKDFYINVLSKIGGDRAILRRFIELTWYDEILPMEATENLPEVKPIYGLISEVYRKYRDRLMATKNLIQLTEALVDCITELYPDFALVASATKDWLNEVRTEKDVEVTEAAESGELRLVQYARRYIQGQVTKAKVLRAILEHGENDGVIVFDRGSLEDVEAAKAGLNAVVISLSGGNNTNNGAGDLTTLINSTAIDPDLREALRIIQFLINENTVIVTFKAKSVLIPGMPRKIWGVERNVYQKNGNKYVGYRFRIDEVVRNVLLGYRG